jgi:radical SAM protein with 4Fe4S-binding SPASM domain
MAEEKMVQMADPSARREGLPFDKGVPYEVIQQVGEDGLSDAPVEAAIFPTYKCNLHCYMCHVHHTRHKIEPEISAERLVNALSNGQISTLFHLGGELFARKDALEVLERFDAQGIRQIISTNGVLIDETSAKKLAELNNLICVQVSLNGTKEVDASIRKSASAFDKTVASIKLLKGLGLPVWLHGVILNENVDNLADLVNLGGELGIDMINLIFGQVMSEQDAQETEAIVEKWLGESVKVGGYVGELTYSLQDLEKSIATAKEAGRKVGIPVDFCSRTFGARPDIYWHGTLREQEKPFCEMVMMPPMAPCVGPVGEIYGCPVVDKTFGNIIDTPLEKIWNSEPLRAFRRGMVNDKLMPVCKRCPSAAAIF